MGVSCDVMRSTFLVVSTVPPPSFTALLELVIAINSYQKVLIRETIVRTMDRHYILVLPRDNDLR